MRHTAFVSVLALAAGANAQIIGGSSIINNGDLNTLEGWLGEGKLKITNIFDQTAGDGKDSTQFHGAADQQGRTFTVIRDETGQIYGGYNPQSWDSSADYHYVDNAHRDAWLFNLTNGIKVKQKQDGDFGQGQYQTYNHLFYGPTFGGGHDLYIPGDLSRAYSYGWSYGNTENGVDGYRPSDQGGGGLAIREMEVFTISNVPAPGAGALLGLGGLMAARRRR